jgi:hypothetical protein
MDRRAFLATGVAAAGLTTAGCSGILGETITLTDPETGTQDDGAEKYLSYHHGGDRIVTLGFDQREVQESPTDRFGFRISVPHSDETTIESFRFDLRAPHFSPDPPADVYLGAPGGGLWPEITFEEVEDFWTRIALADASAVGEGTLTVHTIVDPVSTPVDELGIRAELTLSGSGSRTYEVETTTGFQPVRS